ncbi:hypothetical protein SynA1825c_00789 [Synechococcus sp. A18-25c]|nr:hypothetical protein SynA1825c_00789 [Synechococcus sp. A18-25c]
MEEHKQNQKQPAADPNPGEDGSNHSLILCGGGSGRLRQASR